MYLLKIILIHQNIRVKLVQTRTQICSDPSLYALTDGERVREEAEKTFMEGGGGLPLINMDPGHPSNNPPPNGLNVCYPLD